MIDTRLKRSSLYQVKMKNVLFNMKIDERVRDDFRIAAQLRGASMAGLIHQFMHKVIREEKERVPDAFKVEVEAKKDLSHLPFETQAVERELPKILKTAAKDNRILKDITKQFSENTRTKKKTG